jgi:hypothetical protein
MVKKSDDDQDGGFLQRWSKRKAAVKNENPALADDESLDDQNQALAAEEKPEASLEAAEDDLTDEDLCAKYELTHPDQCDDPEQLDDFFNRPLPDRLKQLAMRRMWRLNPLFRFADEMVEYGENYTDAATVLPDMQSAYKVGKGYFDKLMAEKAEAEDAVAEDAADEDNAEDAVNDEASDSPNPEETAQVESQSNADEGLATEENNPKTPKDVSESVKSSAKSMESASVEEAKANPDEAPIAPPAPPPIRPRRVSFTRK